MTRIGCLHAHHSNIALIEEAFVSHDVELAHFVDPGLLLQSRGSCVPTSDQEHSKLLEQLSWIQACTVDAILITCTQYAANLTAEDEAAIPVPVFTIDGPFFGEIAQRTTPQLLLFSNPATVEPTMSRFWGHANARGLTPAVQIQVVDGAFTLLMENKQEAYREAVSEVLQKLSREHSAALSVAQLSMVPVARQFSEQTHTPVTHPLQSLTALMAQTLQLTSKED